MRVENVWLFVSLLPGNTTALVFVVGAFLKGTGDVLLLRLQVPSMQHHNELHPWVHSLVCFTCCPQPCAPAQGSPTCGAGTCIACTACTAHAARTACTAALSVLPVAPKSQESERK